MPIEGKTISIPAQEYSLYWIVDLRVASSDPTVGPSLRAILRPYKVDGDGNVTFAQNQDKVLSITDLNDYGSSHAGAAAAVQAVMTAVEAAAKEAELI